MVLTLDAELASDATPRWRALGRTCGTPREAQCAFLLIWSSRRDLSTGSPSGKRASRGSLADSRSLSRVALAPPELLGHLPPPLRHSETSSMPLALAPTTTTPLPLGG